MLTSQMTIVLSSVLAQAYGRLLVYEDITIHDLNIKFKLTFLI